MNRLLFTLSSLIFLICIILSNCTKKSDYKSLLLDISKIHKKNPNYLKKEKVIRLENGLEVLLIHDPNANKSAAALSVNVGTLEDPNGNLGLAHFLEHMLFLGTEKFPNVKDYSNFLSKNGGTSNAFTSDETTNFHFQVNHNAFLSALDRFSQFFITPLFNPEYVNKEMNAVHSEYKMYLKKDGQRIFQVLKLLSRKDHPFHRFRIGRLDTLKKIKRDTLLKFHKKYYSANAMKLVLLSNKNLDELKTLAIKFFSPISNNNRKALTYDNKVFNRDKLPAKAYIQPITEMKELRLCFETEPTSANWRTAPVHFFTFFIRHKGTGSLYSYLRQNNLISDLSAGILDSSFTGLHCSNFQLTDKGLKNSTQIIKSFFSYIHFLKEHKLQKYTYEEKKKLGEMDFVYRDHEEGISTVSNLAEAMHTIPALDIYKRRHLFYKFSTSSFEKFLDYFHPNKMMVLILNKNVKTDKTEKYYGIKYKISKFSKKEINTFLTSTTPPSLHYPQKNPYIPSKLDLVNDDKHTDPYKLLASDKATIWFQQDKTVKLPKAKIIIKIVAPEANKNPRHALLAQLYEQALWDGIAEWRYPLALAGLSYEFAPFDRGIFLTISGYSDKMPLVVKEFISRLKEITITKEEFLEQKELFEREFKSWPRIDAYKQAFYHLNTLLSKYKIHQEQFTHLLKQITLDDLKLYARNIYKSIYLELATYGNLKPTVIQSLIPNIYKTLGAKALTPSLIPKPANVKLPSKTLFLKRKSETNNHCWLGNIQFGRRNFRLNAILQLASTYLQKQFYAEMRTKRQYGYIVHSSPSFLNNVLGLNFLIQSNTTNPLKLSKESYSWLQTEANKIKTLPTIQFNAYKNSIIKILQEKDKTIEDCFDHVFHGGFVLNGAFNYKERIISELKKLTPAIVSKELTKAFNKKQGAHLNIFILAQGSKDIKPRGEQIKNLANYKKSMQYY